MSDGKTVDLAAIRARLAAATPGPWEQWTGHLEVLARATDNTHASVRGDAVCEVERYRCSDHDPDPDDTECGCDEEDCKTCRPVQHADADLIAHAPADLAALCDEMERLTADRDAARLEIVSLRGSVDLRDMALNAANAIIAGRTTPPTPEEIEAHHAAGGQWLMMGEHGRCEVAKRAMVLCYLETGETYRWWALDASGAPTQWTVVTPARAKPCECSAAHADEYVAVCDKSCDCLCHE